MALKKSVNLRGLDIPDGYHKIGAVRIDTPQRVYICLDTYANAQAKADDQQPITKTNIETTLEEMGTTKAGFSFKKCYNLIKTRAEYADAEDV